MSEQTPEQTQQPEPEPTEAEPTQQDDGDDANAEFEQERDDTTNVVLGDVNVTGQDNADDE